MSNRLFVGNLSFTTTAENLGKLFETAGEVLEAVIISRGSRSLGYGFVNMKDNATAVAAIDKLNNTNLDGRPIRIELSKSEPRAPGTRPAGAPRGSLDRRGRGSRRIGGGMYGFGGPRRARAPRAPRAPRDPNAPASKTRVYVTSLPYKLTEEELAKVFEGYAVKEALIVRDRYGSSRGYGFVEFASHQDQEKALKEKSSFELSGRTVTLQAALEKPANASSADVKA
ncbi:putative RNA-binding region RNP-1 domain-containing protein [Monocercomonoides exilis]|uniref:putative RNA-binding region RNP-1 domain-containing protein n=1 Tax=Monocercomonoides exilis TaxID=2049356 RepID=UPI00355AC840|nr:putative RNA-binding region RNP-1 domain-containing protein [Monocercomonoides exilis]|eukprot:MONOS_2848.1-p1 / transcript=MONOS_2848.1 / gene=MONOS_2848 / organism=Monocercomonoides_exilis_PA203 / gene_product=RNA-binding region RNP-1 domain-containing protein / transcript_product=RNA-binding region RNP-1 domain-containing protein / location=Mono_scaffold00061:144954-145634(+) / protein_length=226 / sequence_SO=supercontig / SO=protein_coding / is_pseudo=false